LFKGVTSSFTASSHSLSNADYRIDWFPNGQYYLSGTGGGKVTLVDHTTQNTLTEAATVTSSGGGTLRDVAVSHDGQIGVAVFASPNKFVVVDLSTPGSLSILSETSLSSASNARINFAKSMLGE
jgi:hypothetical protein